MPEPFAAWAGWALRFEASARHCPLCIPQSLGTEHSQEGMAAAWRWQLGACNHACIGSPCRAAPPSALPQVSVPEHDSITINYSGPVGAPGNTISLMSCYAPVSTANRAWRKAEPVINVRAPLRPGAASPARRLARPTGAEHPARRAALGQALPARAAIEPQALSPRLPRPQHTDPTRAHNRMQKDKQCNTGEATSGKPFATGLPTGTGSFTWTPGPNTPPATYFIQVRPGHLWQGGQRNWPLECAEQGLHPRQGLRMQPGPALRVCPAQAARLCALHSMRNRLMVLPRPVPCPAPAAAGDCGGLRL